MRNIEHQVVELLSKTGYLQSYAHNKQAEYEQMKLTLKELDKDLQAAHSKINFQ